MVKVIKTNLANMNRSVEIVSNMSRPAEIVSTVEQLPSLFNGAIDRPPVESSEGQMFSFVAGVLFLLLLSIAVVIRIFGW